MKPLSREFLLSRGFCCKNFCLNCPYMELKTVMRPEHGKVGLVEMCKDINKRYLGDLIFVEIGSYMGESAVIFAKELNNAIVYCVDPFLPGFDNLDTASSADFNDVETQFDLRTAPFGNIVKVKMPSIKAKINADIVYIDGCHKYECVKEDIQHWLPQTDFAISGHDYYEDEEFLKKHPHVVGVKKAVDELLGKPDKLYSDGSWIKWLK